MRKKAITVGDTNTSARIMAQVSPGQRNDGMGVAVSDEDIRERKSISPLVLPDYLVPVCVTPVRRSPVPSHQYLTVIVDV